jgi:SAM-dependent methyltransferase
MAKWTKLDEESRVLELGCGSGHSSELLAREFGAAVIAADDDDRGLELLRHRLQGANLSRPVQIEKLSSRELPFKEGEFNAILLYPKLMFPFAAGIALLRRYLAPDGRLLIGYPVHVGRRPSQAALEFWEKKLGEPLSGPGELMQLLTAAGFESETIDTADGLPLDPFYEAFEAEVAQKGNANDPVVRSLRDEIAHHRGRSGTASVAFAMVIGRRREQGEKPAPRRRA